MTATPLARHLADRLGYGPRPGDLDHIDQMGPDRWIDEQLRPAPAALPADVSARFAELDSLRLSPVEAFMEYGPPALRGLAKDPEARKELQEKARVIPAEAIEARILRAVYSPRQLEECMVDFWFNHFNVFVGKGLDRVWISAYERDAIRPHVFGRFRDLLGATAKHPAMSFYLDNWQNTAPGASGARGQFTGLNENYARELMELHTLGVDGGYTQADVIALAKILTGWGFGGEGARVAKAQRRPPGFGKRVRVDRRFPPEDQAREDQSRGGSFVFAEDRHDFSYKTFLGRKIAGKGVAEGEMALDMLARHPATARRISYKLAQYFIADDPPPAAVTAAAETFTRTDGDITAVLKTLFAAPSFRDPATFGTRYKTPLRYVVSSVRATGATVRNFRPLFGMLTQLGQPLYGCLTPDGYKCTEGAWLSADGMTRRVTFAVALAAGRLPLGQKPDDVAGPLLNAKRPEREAERLRKPLDAVKPASAAEPPANAEALIAALGGSLSDKTKIVLATSAPDLRAALVLGSPDFMRC